MTEQEYIQRAEALKPRLYRTALLYLGGEAPAVDAVDEAVYRGLLHHRRLRQPEFFNTWLTRILLNACAAELRRRKRELAVDRWLELDGGRLYVESLELYPTHARLNLEQDPENDAALQSLEFYVEDGKGNRYGRGADNGLVSMGDSHLFESPYFDRPGALTLCVTGAEWLEKGREFVTVDLETGEALTPLPRQVSVRALRTERGQAVVAFLAPEHPDSTPERQHLPRAGTGLCRAPDGTERDIGAVSCRTAEVLWPGTDRETAVPEGYFIEEYVIEDYPWDTIGMGLQYTRRTYFREPVTLPLM